MPKTERLLQRDVLDAASTRTSTSDHGPPADQCNRGGIKIGLEVRSITSVTLSAGRSPGERALTRRSARQTVAERALQHSRQNGSYASWGAAGTTALIGLGCPGAVPAITVVQPGTI